MNAFQLTGLVRAVERDAALDLQVLLRYGLDRVSPGMARVSQEVWVRVPASVDTGALAAGDVVLIRGRVEGVPFRPALRAFSFPDLDPGQGQPGIVTQLVARSIRKVDQPTAEYFRAGRQIEF